MTRRHALDAIRSWPDESREPANWILHVHGEPDDVAASELVWNEIGPWKRVVATRSFVAHETPDRHTASIRSFIAFQVPDDKIDLFAELDGNLEFDAETGEVSACGHDLQANVLAVNLMAEVVTEAITVDEARERYVSALLEAHSGHPPADVTEVHFAGDPTTGEPSHIQASEDHNDVEGQTDDSPGSPVDKAGH